MPYYLSGGGNILKEIDSFGRIYSITNKVNGKRYIGQTKYNDIVNGRYGGNIYTHTQNNRLKNDIEFYGIDCFKIDILCLCDSKKDMCDKERLYISMYDSCNDKYGYNVSPGGGKQDDETQNRIANKCKKFWENNIEKKEYMSRLNGGKNNPMHIKGGHTKESKKKMSNTKKRMCENGEIDLLYARAKSHTKEAEMKRVKTRSKYYFIQYDLNMNEINRWDSMRQMYYDLISNKYEIGYKSYGSFKLKQSQCKVFGDKPFYGYYYKIVKKHANTEEINDVTVVNSVTHTS